MADFTRSEDIVFSREGMKIHGRLYLPEGQGGRCAKYPLAVFSHGLGSNYRELEHYGPVLAGEGISCFLFDFCGGGPESLSDGDFEKMSVQTEIDDLHTVLTEIKKRNDIDSRNIFLMGESQGGYVSAVAAAEQPESVSGLILWYPAFNIREDAEKRAGLPAPERYDFFGLRMGEQYIRDALRIPVYCKIADYKKNVLIIHGDRDDLVPLSVSEKAVQIYESAELKVIRGGGHGFEGDDRWKAAEYSVRFMKKLMIR